MGHNEIFLLWIFCIIPFIESICNQHNSAYVNQGLESSVPLPHKNGQDVDYKCQNGREVPGHSSLSSKCVDNM